MVSGMALAEAWEKFKHDDLQKTVCLFKLRRLLKRLGLKVKYGRD